MLLLLNPAVISFAKERLLSWGDNGDLISVYKTPKFALDPATTPKNLILIFLESTEKTYDDISAFGSTMAPLMPMRNQAVEATKMLEIADTSWSAAGMTATLCGVPLSTIGFIGINRFDAVNRYMPGAICLGDILSKHGYHMEFLLGTDGEFAGSDMMFLQHGFSQITDVDDLEKKYAHQHSFELNEWGVPDEFLFAEAFDRLEKINQTGTPFVVSLITVGGHFPEGAISPYCRNREFLEDLEIKVLKAVKCTNTLLADFLNKAKKIGALENTIVAVQSDHLTMKNTVYDQLLDRSRSNLFFMFGEGLEARKINKPASPLDAYPTLMHAMGFIPEDGRAALGVSMLSDNKTLIDELGIDELNRRIKADQRLRSLIWRGE